MEFNEKERNNIYLISYLISNAENQRVVGYSNLAARLHYFRKQLEADEKLPIVFGPKLEILVTKREDNGLDWSRLKTLLSEAKNDQFGSKFIQIGTVEIGPNEWTHEFRSTAPDAVLERQVEEMVDVDSEVRLKEKVVSAAEMDEEKLIEEVFSQ